jgi:RNA polymerase primary sigma factor
MLDNDSSISLKCYYKDLSKINLVNGEKQTELVIKAQKGDEEAKKKLIESNLRFVVSIAQEYLYSKTPLEDLISDGNIGLIKAIDKFNPKKGVCFISYAVWWIRQSIIYSIYETGDIVRLPINRINIRNKILKSQEILHQELNREPTLSEIEYFSGIEKNDIKTYWMSCNFEVNLESTDTEGSDITVGEKLKNEDDFSIEKTMVREDVSNDIKTVLSTLNQRESKILTLYFGLDNGSALNLREIGEEMDLTNERVRQIKDFALKKLRSYNKSIKLRDYLNHEI